MITLDPYEQLKEECQLRITQLIKELLEKKHLYQSVKLEIDDLLEKVYPSPPQLDPVQLRNIMQLDVNTPWSVNGPRDRDIRHPVPSGDLIRPRIALTLPDIKIYCRNCDRIEAFNAQYCKDCYSENIIVDSIKQEPTIQVFVFSYLCQSCKSIPEFFMVRREARKLTLSGRSPIEHVAVPKVIPKEMGQFFSGAIIAHQSGQTLAGLFLLRTLIEQWVKKYGATHERADDALKWYNETLPEDFKSRFPSLEYLYSQLSATIHAADASQELFDKTVLNIERHFDARRIFNLPHSFKDQILDK